VIVAVGSTRPAKVEGTREALEAIAQIDSRFANVILDAHDLTHIAPRMPMSLAEIIDGARARASALASPERFAVGLEGGLQQLPTPAGEWSLHTWAAVTDGEFWGYGAGPAIIVPAGIAERVLAGEELGDVIDGLAGQGVRGTRGAWGVLTRDLIGRRDAFRLAVIAAFSRFYALPPRA
jgi:inosine/xanthosine triphosphatase